jgi:heat-inducible transcriptional repressor
MMKLTNRQKLILTLIIHEHIHTALPVGSKTLVEKYQLSMSSATVRNEMVQLTDYELLRQPHTSAGRVPTEEGYRYFVGNLIQQSGLPQTTRRTITNLARILSSGSNWLPPCWLTNPRPHPW